MRVSKVIIPKCVLSMCAIVLILAAPLSSQTTPRANRIAQDPASGPVTTVASTVHPLTRRAVDLGPVDTNLQLESLTLNISLSAAQQSELNALLDQQQDPKSPLYHQWLTQEQFGARFGLTDADLSKVTDWLTTQGFRVKQVASSRNAITFSGKAWQVEGAFHTRLHRYDLDGEKHFANATDLRAPAAISGVVTSVRGLNDFRPKPRIHFAAVPEYTINSSYGAMHFLSAGDWAKIYNVNAIYSAGLTGTGAHVGVVGQIYAPQADIDHYRSAAGLPATKIHYQCISTADCQNTVGSSTQGDLGEADMDIELAGGIAKTATVDYIYAANTDTTQNVIDALQYAVQTYKTGGTVVPVLSMSYGGCELYASESEALYFLNLAQQANAQGQTIVVSSGDSGAAGCEPHGSSNYSTSSLGLAAEMPASVPNVTGVGGTYLSGDDLDPLNYWNSSTTVPITALQYIPESTWNESSILGIDASGGGVSTIYPMPSWQSAPSNYSSSSPLGRFVPDVSFSASMDHDGYLTCSQALNSTTTGNTCTDGFLTGMGFLWSAGGTSAGAPSFAGMLTLLTQKYGALGNINPTLYSLAGNPNTYATVFHDITSGSNIVPCLATAPGCVAGQLGYQATTGYDLVTGLGSVDGGGLYAALANLSKLATTTTTVAISQGSLSMGATVTVTASVLSSQAGTISGTVAFTNGTKSLGTVTIANGVATLDVQLLPANGFVAATSALITATYGGDTAYQASDAAATLTVAALPSTATVVTVTPSSLIIGAPATLTANVTSTTSGTINGSVTFSVGSTTIGTAPLSGGTATLSSVATTSANGFVIGSDTITARYSGDPLSYAASSNTTLLTVLPLQATTTTVTASPSSLTAGGTTTLTATVSSTGTGTITGTMQFTVNYYVIATVPVTNGTATLSNQIADYAHHFFAASDLIQASYSGDANFAASSGYVSVAVTPIPTTTTVAVTPSSAMINHDTVNLTVTVSSPSGPVLNSYGYVSLRTGPFDFGSVQLSSSGTATLSVLASAVNGFVVGMDTITAWSSAAGDYAASTGTTTLQVTPQPATTTTISVSPNSVAIGGTTTLTATVSSQTTGTPTGTVTFISANRYISSGPLTNGTATASNIVVNAADGFAAGNDTITAAYFGDSNFAASQGTALLTVTALPSTTSVTATPASVAAGSIVTLSCTISGTSTYAPGGAVIFMVGGTTLGSAGVYNGKASGVWAVNSVNGFVSGSNTITANYQGDGNFQSASATTTVTMVPTYTVSGLNPSPMSPGGSITVPLTVASVGYAGTVSFTATSSSPMITASAPSVTIAADGTATATLTISASKSAANHSPVAPWNSGGAVVFCAVLLGVPFAIQRKRVITVLLVALAVVSAGFLISCGGGGGSTATNPINPIGTPRYYVVTVKPAGSGVVSDSPGVVISVMVQ